MFMMLEVGVRGVVDWEIANAPQVADLLKILLAIRSPRRLPQT
jgi:hypothetical protein